MVYRTSQGAIQLNGIFDFLSVGSSAVASGVTSGAAASLFTGATAATVIPVVGQIAAITAIAAGFIARAVGNAKAGKASLADANTRKAEALYQLDEVNGMIEQIESQKAGVESQIVSLGLGGFGDWLKKTFTPAKYYAGEVEDVNASVDDIYKQIETRISYLTQLKDALQALGDKLTGGSRTQKIVLATGLVTLTGVAFYFLNKKYNWV